MQDRLPQALGEMAGGVQFHGSGLRLGSADKAHHASGQFWKWNRCCGVPMA